MAAQTNLQKDILVLNLEEQLMEIAEEMYGKELSALTDQETYYAVLILTKRLMAVSDCNEGKESILHFRRISDRQITFQQSDQSRRL